jgi:hypothetical protein
VKLACPRVETAHLDRERDMSCSGSPVRWNPAARRGRAHGIEHEEDASVGEPKRRAEPGRLLEWAQFQHF